MKLPALSTAIAIIGSVVAAQASDTFPVPLSEQDTASIRQVCDIARASQLVNLETAGGVAQYCLQLIGNIASAEAEHKKAADAKPAETKPPEGPKK
jgi:hypothetical protein